MGKVILSSLMGEGEPGKYLLMHEVAACESLFLVLILVLILVLRKGQRRLKVAS